MKGSNYKNISFNLNSVIRHEAMHSAQFCRFPGLIALKPVGIDLKYLMPYKNLSLTKAYIKISHMNKR